MKNHLTLENFISIDYNQNAKNTAIEFAHGKLKKNVLTISSSLERMSSANIRLAFLNQNSPSPKTLSIMLTLK